MTSILAFLSENTQGFAVLVGILFFFRTYQERTQYLDCGYAI